MQLSENPSFSLIVFDISDITSTSTQISGLYNDSQYYWRVNASNTNGTSDWSDVWNFTTIVSAPTAPILTSPDNGATDVSIDPTLNWNVSSGASSYRLQLSENASFSPAIFDSNDITSSALQVSELQNNTQYFWRVSASNAGGTSDWSDEWNFTTIVAAPTAPILASPDNGATDVSRNLTLNWNVSSGASSYRLQLSENASFSPTSLDSSSITSNSLELSGLQNNTQYFWRVRAFNIGGTSDWSDIWNFTTIIAAPTVPILTSPNNGAIDVRIDPTLSWNVSSGASSYRLQLSENESFSPTILDSGDVTSVALQVLGLQYNTQYFWRVNATNAGGTSNWSGIWNFTTIIAAPTVPILTSPNNGAIDVRIDPTLSWNVSSGASSYRLQLSGNASFSPTAFDSSGITSASLQVSGLQKNTQYYWRVSATNVGGTSNWSSIWSFTTTQVNILLTSPNGGEKWIINSSHSITWTSKNIVTVNIDYSINNGASWAALISDYTSTGIYSWQIPNTPSSQCLIKIYDSSNLEINDISDSTFSIITSTDLNQNNSKIPVVFCLYQNYPNPFNPVTNIKFDIPETSNVNIEIYNSLGIKMRTLLNQKVNAGAHMIKFNSDNLSSGIYYYKMVAGKFISVKRMLLLR